MVFAPETVPDEVQTLIDEYTAAWDAGDGDAAVALMTADGVHYSGGAQNGKEAADEGALGLAAFIDRMEFATFEPASIAVATHDGPPYEVARIIHVGQQNSTDSFEAVEVFLIVRDADGALRIQTHSSQIVGIE